MSTRLAPPFLVVTVLFVTVALIQSGCATAQVFSGDRQLLSFLHDGTTTRTEVVERLGEPSAQLRADHILTYRIVGSDAAGYGVWAPHATQPDARLSLVLVFDDQGVLQRHALIKVR